MSYRLSHATMLSYLWPTSPVGHLEQFVLPTEQTNTISRFEEYAAGPTTKNQQERTYKQQERRTLTKESLPFQDAGSIMIGFFAAEGEEEGAFEHEDQDQFRFHLRPESRAAGKI